MLRWPLTRGSTTQKGCPTPRAGRDSPSRSTCSLTTLVFLKQSGKSNSTTTTNGITANGEIVLAVLSTNANRMKHAVLCGSIKRPSTEEKCNQYCWTNSLKKKKSTFLNQQEALTKAYCNVALFRKVPITQLYVLVVPLKSLPITVFQVYHGIRNILYLYPGNTVGIMVKNIFLGRKSSYHNSVITIWVMPTRCNNLCEVFCFIA